LIFCANCGKSVGDTARFCTACGSAIASEIDSLLPCVESKSEEAEASEAGFIYVLINPSIQGLVKIGRTTRSPEERATELSASTGMPTPFIVAYSAYVADCEGAERFVHAYREKDGHRLTANREFFAVSIQQAVDAVIEAKRNCGVGVAKAIGGDVPRAGGVAGNYGHEPWRSLKEEADAYAQGKGDVLQDHFKAYRLYEKAGRMGSPSAFFHLGAMHEDGRGCVKDLNKARELYEEAVQRGFLLANISLAELFLKQRQYPNFQKCWGRYFQSEEVQDHLGKVDDPWGSVSVTSKALEYIEAVVQHRLQLEHLSVLRRLRNKIWEWAVSCNHDQTTKELIRRSLFDEGSRSKQSGWLTRLFGGE